MDNASKNAKDMISSLQMQYNRGRQAAITNELVDIITGASSLLLFVIRSLITVYVGASAL
jgi:F0F1-type ATP synthase gamma subunit